MLNVLLESKAVRAKRMGGTLTSVLVHGAIIAGVIALGVRPRSIDARMPDFPKEGPIYVPVEPRPDAPKVHSTRSNADHPTAPAPAPMPRIDDISPGIPPIDVSAPPITDATEFGRGVSTPNGGTDRRGVGGPLEGVLEER